MYRVGRTSIHMGTYILDRLPYISLSPCTLKTLHDIGIFPSGRKRERTNDFTTTLSISLLWYNLVFRFWHKSPIIFLLYFSSKLGTFSGMMRSSQLQRPFPLFEDRMSSVNPQKTTGITWIRMFVSVDHYLDPFNLKSIGPLTNN